MADDSPATPAPIPPDSLSQSEREFALRVMGEKGILSAKCELCSAAAWHFVSDIYTPVAMGYEADRSATTNVTGMVFPSLVILCTSCGNTKLLNVYALGIRKRGEGPKPPESPDGR